MYFPESQYVHIIRDGRDVVVSMRSFAKKRPAAPWGRFSFEQLCSAWVETTSRLRSHGLRLGQARYHEVRYEGLLATEQETLFGVFEFLGDVSVNHGRVARRRQPMRLQHSGIDVPAECPKDSVAAAGNDDQHLYAGEDN